MAGAQQILQGLLNALKSRVAATATLSMVGTGSYVSYKDRTRYPRISAAFKKGCILAPMKDNHFEITYHPRVKLENKLKEIMGPRFTNQYYLINGEVGSGKTRTIVEVVRELLHASNDDGAPIYVVASQGKSLPDTLAEAINFSFDEHISFQFFVDYILQIHSFPSKDEHHKMTRVLDAIEKAAFQYMQKEGRPAVIIIDGINSVGTHQPETLQKLQEKAKLWADCNIVKLILISNDEATGELLQKNCSNWSRAAAPLKVGDMSKEDSLRFLMMADFFEGCDRNAGGLELSVAEDIYNFVGGRIQLLISFKRHILNGGAFEDVAELFKEKEREKFLHLKRSKNVDKVLRLIAESNVADKRGKVPATKGVLMSKLVEETSDITMKHLLEHDIVKFDRFSSGLYVNFESRLMEHVVKELELLK